MKSVLERSLWMRGLVWRPKAVSSDIVCVKAEMDNAKVRNKHLEREKRFKRRQKQMNDKWE